MTICAKCEHFVARLHADRSLTCDACGAEWPDDPAPVPAPPLIGVDPAAPGGDVSVSVEFETFATDELVCPHCGHQHDNSFEHHREKEGVFVALSSECDKCGKPFEFTVDYSVTYTTRVPRSAAPGAAQ